MPLDTFIMPRQTRRDPETGREVWQVTDGEWECAAPYMDIMAWSAGDRELVFMCNRLGSWQPYALELATGRARQLWHAGGTGARGVAIAARTDEAYCHDGARMMAVRLDALVARVAVDFGAAAGPAPKGHAAALNGAGTEIVTSLRTPDGTPALLFCRTDGSGRRELRPLPAATDFPDWPNFTPGHEAFCPTDDALVSFCGSPDRQNDGTLRPAHRPREWRFDRRTGEARPLVLMPPGFRATHCLWGASGQRFYFHRKTVPTWTPTALCSVNRDGGDLRVYHETSAHRLGHSAPSPDERWLVTDSQDPDRNILMLVSTQTGATHLLCWPNMSINSGRPDRRLPHLPAHTDRHPHPGFSRSGRLVHYTSDVSGRSQVYIVPIGDLV